MMRIAPEGWPFIGGALLIGAGFLVLGWSVPALLWMVVVAWVVAFFRDPAPPETRDPGVLLAPADGKVVSVMEIDEPAFFGDRAIRVSIFMNVFDCHVNRYPCDGRVAYRHYNAGRFGHAGTDKASLENEQASIGLETPRGKVLVRQIAGLVARRIVTDHAIGTDVKQAQRLGMIRFGSRVDLFLPPGTEVRVAVGDRTRVARTVVAAWR
ncbi:MAG TPA: phosphatidylserine decarboxylase family protein [Gemmatimonadales bacterium]|nr:phosphatidylserine decarboxylase family protein [Gemmatimonadales bacterium]